MLHAYTTMIQIIWLVIRYLGNENCTTIEYLHTFMKYRKYAAWHMLQDNSHINIYLHVKLHIKIKSHHKVTLKWIRLWEWQAKLCLNTCSIIF